MEIKEIWKTIENYPNYQVSNLGNIKSLNYKQTGKEKILKLCKNNKNYCQVFLSKNGKEKPYLVHRLVATAFIENSDNLPIINHKDENPQNNTIENLEWCSYSYNSNYGTRNEKCAKIHIGNKYNLGKKRTQTTKDKISKSNKGKKRTQEQIEKSAKARQKPILQLSKSGNIILSKFNSAKQASELLNIDCGNITKCCRGKYKNCGGYKWMYYNDYTNRMNEYLNLALKKVS